MSTNCGASKSLSALDFANSCYLATDNILKAFNEECVTSVVLPQLSFDGWNYPVGKLLELEKPHEFEESLNKYRCILTNLCGSLASLKGHRNSGDASVDEKISKLEISLRKAAGRVCQSMANILKQTGKLSNALLALIAAKYFLKQDPNSIMYADIVSNLGYLSLSMAFSFSGLKLLGVQDSGMSVLLDVDTCDKLCAENNLFDKSSLMSVLNISYDVYNATTEDFLGKSMENSSLSLKLYCEEYKSTKSLLVLSKIVHEVRIYGLAYCALGDNWLQKGRFTKAARHFQQGIPIMMQKSCALPDCATNAKTEFIILLAQLKYHLSRVTLGVTGSGVDASLAATTMNPWILEMQSLQSVGKALLPPKPIDSVIRPGGGHAGRHTVALFQLEKAMDFLNEAEALLDNRQTELEKKPELDDFCIVMDVSFSNLLMYVKRDQAIVQVQLAEVKESMLQEDTSDNEESHVISAFQSAISIYESFDFAWSKTGASDAHYRMALFHKARLLGLTISYAQEGNLKAVDEERVQMLTELTETHLMYALNALPTLSKSTATSYVLIKLELSKLHSKPRLIRPNVNSEFDNVLCSCMWTGLYDILDCDIALKYMNVSDSKLFELLQKQLIFLIKSLVKLSSGNVEAVKDLFRVVLRMQQDNVLPLTMLDKIRALADAIKKES